MLQISIQRHSIFRRPREVLLNLIQRLIEIVSLIIPLCHTSYERINRCHNKNEFGKVEPLNLSSNQAL
jgi:hypothetical protein